MRILDLFCGTGAFSRGFEKAVNGEYKTVFGIDLLKPSVETFRLNHRHAWALAEDIRNVDCQSVAEKIGVKPGELELIVGGPPCQGFSSIRPFRSSGVDDPRNSLFEQFARFVKHFMPLALVMENVVGLATHNGGTDIERIVKRFGEIGYSCDWRILNAAHFGVPQKRERLILIGTRDGIRFDFPNPTHQCDGRGIGYKDRTRMLMPMDDLFGEELAPALSVMDAIGDLPPIASGETGTCYHSAPQNGFQNDRRAGSDELTMHYSTAHTEKMLEIIKHSGPNINSIPKHLITSGFSSCYSRLDADKPSVTITVNFVHPASNRCIHPKCDRALTPREGARLQSFDDTFVFFGNRSQVVKQIGNAVPPLLGKAIGEALAPSLNGVTT